MSKRLYSIRLCIIQLCIASMCLISPTAQAHLLNMTEANAGIYKEANAEIYEEANAEIYKETNAENYLIELQLELDLLSELGSAESYYAFAQLSADQILIQHKEMLERLAASIFIHQQGQVTTPEIIRVSPPSDKSLSDFQSDFIWPMTGISLQARLPSPAPLRIQFQTGFIFEEPIALSMHSSLTKKRKSRWLVAGQTSPSFNWALEPGSLVDENNDLSDPISLATIVDYLKFGFLHILPYGWDHLLFVLMMYLSVASTKQLIIRISLFTLAHSITLGLASYRVIEMSALITEALISLSILFMALANLWGKSSKAVSVNRKKLATENSLIFAFGLLHGLGFGASLNNLGNPVDHFLISLLSFNIGVELGQILFILGLSVLIGRYKTASFWHVNLVKPLSVGTAGIIGLWLYLMFA